jgi:hypothetical protein
MGTKFWSENLKGKYHSEELGVDGRYIRMCLREMGGKLWIGFIWLRKAKRGAIL